MGEIKKKLVETVSDWILFIIKYEVKERKLIMGKHRKKKKVYQILSVGLILSGIICVFVSSRAYYDRGKVTVICGMKNMSLEPGKEMTISLNVNPIQDSQTPGCGMAECPDTCGPTCMDENGNCTCAGKEYQIYKTDISVVTSNPSVAVGTCYGGTLVVRAVGPGEATLTVKGNLREWTSGTDSVQVLVTEKSEQTEELEKPEKPEKPKEPEKPLEQGESTNSSHSSNTMGPANTGQNEEEMTHSSKQEQVEQPQEENQPTDYEMQIAKEIRNHEIEKEKHEVSVPKLEKNKVWKVYAIQNMQKEEEQEQMRQAETTSKRVAAFTGFTLFLAGIGWEIILYFKRR